MTAVELARRIKEKHAPTILDVRTANEFNSGHIQGAIHAPLAAIFKTTSKLAQSNSDLLILTCEHGPRAQLARVLLKWHGYRNIELLEGHMSNWRRSGLPVKTG